MPNKTPSREQRLAEIILDRRSIHFSPRQSVRYSVTDTGSIEFIETLADTDTKGYRSIKTLITQRGLDKVVKQFLEGE